MAEADVLPALSHWVTTGQAELWRSQSGNIGTFGLVQLLGYGWLKIWTAETCPSI
jgi:hypothetical protein